MFIILSHWDFSFMSVVTASKLNLSWLIQCPFVYYLESFYIIGFWESYTFWETLLSFWRLEGGGHWQYLCLSNDSLFSSYGKIIWRECLKPVNNPHPGKSRTIAFLPPWALVLVASRAQEDASFHHIPVADSFWNLAKLIQFLKFNNKKKKKVAFSLKKWWRRLGTQMTGRHFFFFVSNAPHSPTDTSKTSKATGLWGVRGLWSGHRVCGKAF